MPGTKRKAQCQLDVAQAATETLPELPMDLWRVIFDHVICRGGDMAQVRLVNKLCARVFTYRLYAEKLDRQFKELHQKRTAMVATRNALVVGTNRRAWSARHSNHSFGEGMALSDSGFQRFVWNVICSYNSGAYDDALMASRLGARTQGRVALLKMCIDAMRSLSRSS